MPYFKVQLPTTAICPRQGNADCQIVYALTNADALAAAQAFAGSAAGGSAWAAATVTELGPQVDMAGVTLTAVVNGVTFSYTGVAADTLASLIVGLAAAMNTNATLFPTTVTTSGLVLTIPAGNNLGAVAITSQLTEGGNPVAVTMATDTVSATGAAGTSRTITLAGGTLAGVRLRMTIADPTNPVDLSVYCNDGETIDAAGARLVALVDASPLIGGGGKVTYTGGSNTITITGATAAQGAKVITCSITKDDTLVLTQPVVNAPGISSIDRTAILPADGSLPVAFPPKSFGLFHAR